MKSCCDEYCSSYGCNQGRNCPARVARIGRKHSMDDEFRRAQRIGYKQADNLRRSPFVVAGVLLILIGVSLAAIVL